MLAQRYLPYKNDTPGACGNFGGGVFLSSRSIFGLGSQGTWTRTWSSEFSGLDTFGDSNFSGYMSYFDRKIDTDFMRRSI